MKKSFRTKVIAVFLIGIILFTAALSFLCSAFLREIFIIDSKDKMKTYSRKISEIYNETDKCNKLIHDIEFSYNIKTYISDVGGNIISEYTVSSLEYNSERFKLWIDDYRKSKQEENYHISSMIDEADGINRIVFVRQIGSKSYIIMTKAVKGIDQDIYLANMFIVLCGTVLAIFGTLVWSVSTKPFTKQIEKMSRITKNMAELNFEEKLDYESEDEIGILAKSVNSLSVSLDKSISELHEDIEKRKQILRDLSHEIKTPITTIRGYTENIEIVGGDNERIKKYCKIMLEECDEITKLINEMLMMSKLESGEYFTVEDDISTDYIRDFVAQRVKNEFIENEVIVNLDYHELRCNSSLIYKSVMNLIENAAKYGYRDTPIYFTGFERDGYYCFEVKNSGDDILPEDQKRIWDAFYKSDKSRNRNNSHGVGLSIVYAVAQLHEGFVELKSENNTNTFSFTVKL